MQITWLSYFGSENQGLPLRSWFVTCWLWRHIPIVTSLAVPSSCVVTQTPMGTNSCTRRQKHKFPLLFVNCDRGRIEIDHLYGLRWSGWYCNPEQHSLCRPARPQAAARRPAQLVLFLIAVPTTPAQTVSWSIPITSYTSTMHQYPYFFPFSNAIFAHCINQTNATSGFYPVAFFKMSLKCNEWSKSNKNRQNLYWPPHIYYVWKLEQTTKNKL